MHCSFLGTVGREMEDNWEEKGQGAVFYLQQEMSDSISGEGRVIGARCQLSWQVQTLRQGGLLVGSGGSERAADSAGGAGAPYLLLCSDTLRPPLPTPVCQICCGG